MFDDQLAALEADSKRHGTQGEAIDFALLVDGLRAEREQGITIDVAYRYFASEKRKFIVADTPGHEQYTRNMVTGASTADLAVLLVDARKGVLTQTRRHSYLAQLLGIRRFVLAVNKMDLVDFDQGAFDAIAADYRAFAEQIGIERLAGDPGVRADRRQCRRPRATRWPGTPGRACSTSRHGAARRRADAAQAVPDAGAVGQPAQPRFPRLRRPDRVGHDGGRAPRCGPAVGPASTRIERIVTADGDLDEAVAGQSVTLTFADEVDCSRGDVDCRRRRPARSRPTSSRRRSSGWPRGAAARAAATG